MGTTQETAAFDHPSCAQFYDFAKLTAGQRESLSDDGEHEHFFLDSQLTFGELRSCNPLPRP